MAREKKNKPYLLEIGKRRIADEKGIIQDESLGRVLLLRVNSGIGVEKHQRTTGVTITFSNDSNLATVFDKPRV